MVSIECLTPAQQKEYRKAENTFHVFRPAIHLEVVDAMMALEQLVLIEHADNVDKPVKERIKLLRTAIKSKMAHSR